MDCGRFLDYSCSNQFVRNRTQFIGIIHVFIDYVFAFSIRFDCGIWAIKVMLYSLFKIRIETLFEKDMRIHREKILFNLLQHAHWTSPFSSYHEAPGRDASVMFGLSYNSIVSSFHFNNTYSGGNNIDAFEKLSARSLALGT